MALADHTTAVQDPDDRRWFKYMSRSTAQIVLQQRTLRWSTPGTLNDPFDNQFDLHIDIDLEAAKRLAVPKLWGAYLGVGAPPAGTPVGDFVRRLRGAQPRIPRAEFESVLSGALAESFARLDDHVEELQRQLRPHIAQHKLLCLATSGSDIPMWAYYADNHRGVVLSFRSASPNSPWSAGQAVRYQQGMPRLFDEEVLSDIVSGRARLADPVRAILEKIVFTKSVAWAHEGEWRVFSGPGRNPELTFEDISFNALELDALIVGCSMPAADRTAFADMLQSLYPHAEVREAVKHDRQFALTIQPLPQG